MCVCVCVYIVSTFSFRSVQNDLIYDGVHVKATTEEDENPRNDANRTVAGRVERLFDKTTSRWH